MGEASTKASKVASELNWPKASRPGKSRRCRERKIHIVESDCLPRRPLVVKTAFAELGLNKAVSYITWDSGHYSILRPNKREFIYKMVEPGLIIEDDETIMRPAARVVENRVPRS